MSMEGVVLSWKPSAVLLPVNSNSGSQEEPELRMGFLRVFFLTLLYFCSAF